MTAQEQPVKAVSLKAKHTRKQAHQRLQSAINCLQRKMYLMECFLEKLDVARSDDERAWVMNSAIEHLVSNIFPDLRIDLLAQSQAELAKLGA